MNYLCIDLGTTKIKLSLFNENCDLIYYSEADSTIHKKNDLIFQNPDDYFFLIQKEIEKIKNIYTRDFVKINSIIFSGQMGGILGVDSNYEVIFPWTYSIDTAYLSYVYSLEQELGEKIRKKSGGTPTIAGKICWIKDKFPEKYKRIKKFLNLMGFVAGKLCDLSIKDSFIDCTCLSMTGMADIENLKWDHDLDDIYIALLESNGYEIKYSLELLCKINKLDVNNLNEIKIIGSGSKNYLENFIKTNILNIRYIKMSNQPYENIGTFVLAKYGMKLRGGVKELIESGKIRKEYEIIPTSYEKEIYQKNYNKYLRIVEKLQNLYLNL